ncbi:glycosyltransferase involved in cell wall biosynthesis [Alkalihalobacillus xiaoxiensis]|uniref:Glycosyltransferase involved in cell wall biosynthesis n=1 Tax=Shouchella xiaoxiensis TaxID=766895 RepID=A0ABS2STK6_9BACI|nr:glycosyltransferase involved in cell wall biosynthesis [Shouchella xiaoxiensis]
MTKVCMLVHTHSFLDTRIFQKEAKSLQKHGYEVVMIVPRIKGKLFRINKEPFENELLETSFMYEGIKIVTYDFETFKPTVEHMQEYIDSDTLSFNNPLVKLGLAENADVYHAHEVASLFAGIGIKRLRKKNGKPVKLIFDSHDLIPDPFDKKPKFIAMGKLLDDMLTEIDQLITVSPSIKAYYITKQPLLPIEILYNSPPLNHDYQARVPKETELTVGYEGHVADNKKGSSDKIYKITELAKQQVNSFTFKIIGGVLHGHKLDVPKDLQPHISLTGWVPFEGIAKEMAEVDIGWIDFDDLSNSLNRSYALPNKFFSYLNNGIPVIVNKCHDMEQFIQTHQCGIVLNKQKATGDDYAEAVLYLHQNRDLLKQMSVNARKAMENLYNWEKMEQRMLQLYETLLADKPKSFYIEK